MGDWIQAVIFDRDGVLTYFDTEALSERLRPLIPISLNELVQEWDAWGEHATFPASVEEEKRFLHGFWTEVGRSHGLSEIETAELLAIDYTDFVAAYPDAVPALEAVRCGGKRVAVLSNFTLASLDLSLNRAGLGHLVDVACAATVIGVAKPDAKAYLEVAKRLGVKPETCLFVDDEELCVVGARRVGMQAFQLRRATNNRVPLWEEKNTLRDLGQLVDLLES